MSKEIIYSKNEYETNYNKLLENFKSTFEEVDEIDFIKDEIQDYKLYSLIVASRTNVVFNPIFNVFTGSASAEEGYAEEVLNFLKDNKSIYFSIREVIGLHPEAWSLWVKIEDIDIKVKQLRLGFSKILNFLEERKLSLETETKTPKHNNIFSNNGFELFEHILKEYIKPKGVTGRQSDLVYYHKKMYDNNPQYIHRKPTDFFKWFDTEYSETSGQLVTYERVKNPIREKDYSTALEWFRLQEKTV